MPVIIFKEPSCKLKSSNGLFLLKGNYEINIVDEATLKDLKKHNPEFDMWVDKGYITINEKEDNVKTDGLLMQQKQAEQKLIDAEKKAKEIIDAAYKQAEEIKKAAERVVVVNNYNQEKETAEEQSTDDILDKTGKKK